MQNGMAGISECSLPLQQRGSFEIRNGWTQTRASPRLSPRNPTGRYNCSNPRTEKQHTQHYVAARATAAPGHG